MLVFKKSYYKKIKDLEKELEKSKKNEKNLKEIIELNVENPVNEKNKEISKLIEINSKLEKQLNSGKVTNEKNKELLNNISRNTKDLKEQLTNLLSENKALQANLKLKVTELEKETNICKGEKLKVENLEREVNESKAREAKLQKMLNLDLENQKDEIKKLKAELIQKNSKLDREISISKGEKLKVENLRRHIKEKEVRLQKVGDLDLESQKKEKTELKIKIETLLKDRLRLEEKLNNEVSINKKNEKLLVDTSKGERKLENEIDKQQLEIRELKEIEVELRRTMDLSLENLSKQKDEKLKKLEKQLNEKILVNKRRKQFLIDTSKDTEILKKQLASLMSDNKKLKKEKTDLKQNIVDQLQLNKSIKLSIEKELDIRTAEVEKLKIKLKDKDKKIKLLPIQSARSEALLKHQIEDLKQKRDDLFELVKTLRNNKGKVTPLQKIQASENKKMKIEIELNKTIKLNLEDQLANQIAKNIKLQNDLKLKSKFKSINTKIEKENKDLQDKLHQKERSAFKLSIISKEATNNLSLLKGQLELLSNDNLKYKTRINSLEEQLKETEESKQLKVSFLDPINKSKDSLEKQIQAKENLKPNSSSQLNENLNIPADIKSLNKKQWNEVLEFGTKHKIFNNRDKQKLNNIIVRLKIREPLRPAQIEEGEELFNLVVKNGFRSSIAAPLSSTKKIEEESCSTPFGKKFNRNNLKVSEEKMPEVLEKTNQLDEDELLEKVKAFKYDEWTQMFEWAKKKKKLKSKDLSLLNGLAIRSSNKELSENELILGLELYFILMSEGFELIKEKDVDDFLMQFANEGVNRVSTMDKKEEIPDILKNILF